jgi:hypothetical protein
VFRAGPRFVCFVVMLVARGSEGPRCVRAPP